jgi:hypothetical protein
LLRYFKLFDPYRLFALVIILAVLRFAWWYGLYPPGSLALHADYWGRLVMEGFIPYLDIRGDLGPISILVYSFIKWIPVDSILAQRVLAMVLLSYQAIAFNAIVAKFRMHKELSNFPAFAYIILGITALHGASLSPTMIALSLLMPAMSKLAAVLAGKQNEDSFFSIGFFFSLAMLAELRISILLLCLIWVLLAFSDANGKKIGILLIGCLFPFLLVFVLGSFLESNTYMWRYLFNALLELQISSKLDELITWIPLFPLAFVMLIVLLFHQGVRGLSVNQQKFKNLYLSWIFFSICGLLVFNDTLGDGLYLIILPAGAYFLGHFWLLAKSKWWRIPIGLVLFLQVLWMNGRPIGALLPLSQNPWDSIHPSAVENSPFLVDEGTSPVWVIGGNQKKTTVNYFPGLYLQGAIQDREFKNIRTYSGLLRVSQAFEKQAPVVIIDSMGVMEEVFVHLPQFQNHYVHEDSLVYRKIN